MDNKEELTSKSVNVFQTPSIEGDSGRRFDNSVNMNNIDNSSTKEEKKVDLPTQNINQNLGNSKEVMDSNLDPFMKVGAAPISARPNKPKYSQTNAVSYFDGDVFELGAYHFLSGFISTFTFGIFRPWGICMVKKYIAEHTVINGKRLKFEGDGAELFVKRFKWMLFAVLTLGIYLFFIPIKTKQWEVSKTHFVDEKSSEEDCYFLGSVSGLIGLNILSIFLSVISLGLLLPYVHCKRKRWFISKTVINRRPLVFAGKAGNLMWKQFKWTILTIITLGIYGMWLNINKLKWDSTNTYIMKRV